MAERFVERFCKRHHRPGVMISRQTMEWLCAYPWPGNVRELRNTVEAGVVVCNGGDLRVEDLLAAGVPGATKTQPAKPTEAPLSLEGGERKLILEALERSHWVQKDAARLLGISRKVLHYKIRKFGIQIPGRSPAGLAEEGLEEKP